MENKNKRAKWLVGYFIYLSLVLTANHFINIAIDSIAFITVTLLVYLGVFLLFVYRKTTVKVLLVALAMILLIYGTDYALTRTSDSDMVLEGGTETLESAQNFKSDLKRHDIAWVHQLRDAVDYQKVVTFGEWMVQDRIQNQLIEGEKTPINLKYELIFFVLMLWLLSVVLLIIYHVKWLKILFVAPVVLYVWLWFRYVDLSWTITGMYFCGVVAFFIMEHRERLLKTHKDYNTSYYPTYRVMLMSLITSGIVIMVSIVFTQFFPIKQVNSIVDFITPNLWGARSGYSGTQINMYSLKDTPFSGGSDILGGPVLNINTEDPIFWVKFDRIIDKAVYLKTNVKDKYDGLRWTSTASVYKNNYKFYLSEPQNIKLMDTGAYDQINGSIKLNKKRTKTVTLFTPMGLFDTSLNNDKVFVSTENEAFYKAGAFVQHLKEYAFSATQRDFYFDTGMDYLQLSNRIETKTIQLSKAIGGLANTDFEKMRYVSQFLSSNYEYSLTPLSNSTRRDFVSQFLFEGQKGYCTYFASSMVIMARANGIPARYVEGFRVDPDEVGGIGRYSKVTEKDAHAWAEVYLEGFGWVIFESTPAYVTEETNTGVPSLAEMLEEQEKAEAEGNQGENQNGENGLNPDGFENQDLIDREDFQDEFSLPTYREREEEKKSSVIPFLLLTLALLGVAFVLWKLPLRYLRRQNTHKFATRLLYYLAYLHAEALGYTVHEPEFVFSKLRLDPHDVKLWLKVLYDEPDKITPDMIRKCISSTLMYTKQAKSDFIYVKGKWAYLNMRLFKIQRLIP